MRMSFLFLALVSCSDASTEGTAYLLEAAAGRGIEPDNLIIVPNAKTVLEDVLHRCEIAGFREVKISDGLVGFRFELQKKEQSSALNCIRKTMPRGAWVEETIVP